ncbi:MAG: holo-ACP synthase [Sulfuriferula sp.]
MIYGIGTDVVSIRRIAGLLQRHGERALLKILAAKELESFAAHNAPERLLAKRFAAKEAFAKAVGTGLRAPVSLTNIAIIHNALGRPQFEFAPPLHDWLVARGVTVSHLSISDESDMVVAFVILEECA